MRGLAGGTSSLRRIAVREIKIPPREFPNVGDTVARDVVGIVGSTLMLNICDTLLNCSVQIESDDTEESGEKPEMRNKS